MLVSSSSCFVPPEGRLYRFLIATNGDSHQSVLDYGDFILSANFISVARDIKQNSPLSDDSESDVAASCIQCALIHYPILFCIYTELLPGAVYYHVHVPRRKLINTNNERTNRHGHYRTTGPCTAIKLIAMSRAWISKALKIARPCAQAGLWSAGKWRRGR